MCGVIVREASLIDDNDWIMSLILPGDLYKIWYYISILVGLQPNKDWNVKINQTK